MCVMNDFPAPARSAAPQRHKLCDHRLTRFTALGRGVLGVLTAVLIAAVVIGLTSARVPPADAARDDPPPSNASPARVGNATEPPPLRLHAPTVALRGVPIDRIVVEHPGAANTGGPQIDDPERILLSGVRIVRNGRVEEPVRIALSDGRAVIRTDWASETFVYVTRPSLVATGEDGMRATTRVHLLHRWAALVPPLLAILLCVVARDVYIALFVAVWTGAAALSPETGWWDAWNACVRTLDAFVIEQLTEPSSQTFDHARILVFTLLLGGMVGVQQLAAELLRADAFSRARASRRRGQLATVILGCLVFFDDYANTLFVGGTMRSLRRHMRMSAEKLAFLIDATAAPVAGLAIVSTWVGFEIGQIEAGLEVSGASAAVGGYELFLWSLPYRLYPLVLLLLVFLVAATGRDFGPMWRAEAAAGAGDAQAEQQPQSNGPGQPPFDERGSRTARPSGDRPGARRSAPTPVSGVAARWPGADALRAVAAVAPPLVALLGVLAAELWISGGARSGVPAGSLTLWQRLAAADANAALLHASFAALVTALVAAVASGVASFRQAVAGALRGMAQMLPALIILVLAWGLAAVCDGEHLNTAGAMVAQLGTTLSPADMPWVTFLLAAVMSFATGSSFSTMGLLMPVVIAVTHHLLAGSGIAAAEIFTHPNMLGAVGAVLAGAIFGDHCSPISDTTVLSSAAAGCDHLRHVVTQLPYALLTAFCVLVAGYFPLRFGVGIVPCVSLAAGAVIISFWCLSRPVAPLG